MNNILKQKDFKEAFEQEEAELNYRFKETKKINDDSIVLMKPKESYQVWANKYNQVKPNLDIYDYIITHISNNELEVLTGEKAEQFININPVFDTDQIYISRKIDELLTYNNIKLNNVTSHEIARIYYDDILNSGDVIQYILEEEFIKSLIDKGFVDIKLVSPF